MKNGPPYLLSDEFGYMCTTHDAMPAFTSATRTVQAAGSARALATPPGSFQEYESKVYTHSKHDFIRCKVLVRSYTRVQRGGTRTVESSPSMVGKCPGHLDCR